ncbi:hypothetical protein ACJMK2_026318 [Sinanodonta woodiana]|uniref:RNA-binding protein 42 n=1 Tax=Sinanodonta woodiana TaxID=1069815 RepID=A0ABD3XMX8_SINWO
MRMAVISEQKLKEMEAEMDRFEQEIQGPSPKALPRVIIGSDTYNQVSAQLKALRESVSSSITESKSETRSLVPPPPPPPPPPPVGSEEVSVPLSVLSAPPPPPPPSTTDSATSSVSTSSSLPYLAPPPPPPPVLRPPAFVPPQLRMRPPPPPPLRLASHTSSYRPHHPGMPGPPSMGPPVSSMHHPGHPYGPMGHHPGGPFHPRGLMGPMSGPMVQGGPHSGYMGPYGPAVPGPMYGMYGVSTSVSSSTQEEDTSKEEISSSGVIEKPKVVYSAAPALNIVTKTKRKKNMTAKTDIAVFAETSAPVASSDNVSDSAVSTTTLATEESFIPTDMEIDTTVSGNLTKKEKKEKKKKFIRTAAGTTWEDPTLNEWDQDDFRLFCGDLGNEATDELLTRAFAKYPSFIKAKVVRDKRSNKTRGYGFVSFKDPNDFARAMREMNGKYVGNRPIKLRKSSWKDRNIEIVRKKEKEKKRLGLR